MDNEEMMTGGRVLFKWICLWKKGGIKPAIEEERMKKNLVCGPMMDEMGLKVLRRVNWNDNLGL